LLQLIADFQQDIELNIEVKYWGVPLTEVLTNGEKLLTI
jgi:hypothetical protein